MKSKNYTGLFGALLVISGGIMPMIQIPIIGNWNYWDLDLTLASIIYLLAVLAIIAVAANKRGLLRFCGWAIILVLLFTLAAVYLKINQYFSFIPLKKLAMVASRLVHYRWEGWAVIAIGAFIILISRKRIKKEKFIDN